LTDLAAGHPAQDHPTETAPASLGVLSPESRQSNGTVCEKQARRFASSASLPDSVPGNGPVRAPLDAFPGTSGTGTGTAGSISSGGVGPATPAWLSAHHLPIPHAGMAAVHGRLLAAPAPVALDPGSSPD
jgi:hypothetical protein